MARKLTGKDSAALAILAQARHMDRNIIVEACFAALLSDIDPRAQKIGKDILSCKPKSKAAKLYCAWADSLPCVDVAQPSSAKEINCMVGVSKETVLTVNDVINKLGLR